MPTGSILEIQDLNKFYAGLAAIQQCNLQVKHGSITGLIGPNGAGKSTLFNIIAGTIKCDSGVVKLDKKTITGSTPQQLFNSKVLRTFQIPKCFSELTVIENLMVVPAQQAGERWLNNWLWRRNVHQQEKQIYQRALEVCKFLHLDKLINVQAKSISGGQKKLLELGRTMMVEAKLILLDEVAAGVNKTLLKVIIRNIKRLNKEQAVTFFVIEHDMDLIAEICDPVIVMARGKIIDQGNFTKIRNNPDVIKAYFGDNTARPE